MISTTYIFLQIPDEYEGNKVSIAITVAEIDNQTLEEGQLLETTKGLHVFIPSSLGRVAIGDHISLRGISYLSSLGYIEVTELYLHDYPINGISRSLFHSIPSILTFIFFFFAIFRFAPSRTRLVPQRD
ncbi:MAG: hypothetical protein ACOC38_10955 [Promethearchaeia archaeon]